MLCKDLKQTSQRSCFIPKIPLAYGADNIDQDSQKYGQHYFWSLSSEQEADRQLHISSVQLALLFLSPSPLPAKNPQKRNDLQNPHTNLERPMFPYHSSSCAAAFHPFHNSVQGLHAGYKERQKDVTLMAVSFRAPFFPSQDSVQTSALPTSLLHSRSSLALHRAPCRLRMLWGRKRKDPKFLTAYDKEF